MPRPRFVVANRANRKIQKGRLTIVFGHFCKLKSGAWSAVVPCTIGSPWNYYYYGISIMVVVKVV